MRLVIADTVPINYLILIGPIDLLAALFEKAILPVTVHGELTSVKAPSSVRQWIAARPAWLEVHNDLPLSQTEDPVLTGIERWHSFDEPTSEFPTCCWTDC